MLNFRSYWHDWDWLSTARRGARNGMPNAACFLNGANKHIPGCAKIVERYLKLFPFALLAITHLRCIDYSDQWKWLYCPHLRYRCQCQSYALEI